MMIPGTFDACGAAVVALTLAILVPSCGSTDTGATNPSTSTKPTSSQGTLDGEPVGMLAACAPASAEPFTAQVNGGDAVDGMILGRGSRAVVLSYEWGSTPCGWSEVAEDLVDDGYQVVLWEYGTLTGLDRIAELQAVVDEVRDHGARHVVLAGGSLGGCVAMIGASKIEPAVSGVAVLSCASWYDVEHRIPTTPWAAKVRVPALYLTSTDDANVPVAEVRRDFRAIPTRDKQLVVVPHSSQHGVGILTEAGAGRLAKPSFMSFLDRVTK